jgi:hypothetical protein
VTVNAQDVRGAYGPRVLDCAKHTVHDGFERHTALGKALRAKKQLSSTNALFAGFRKIRSSHIVEVLLSYENSATFEIERKKVLKVCELISGTESIFRGPPQGNPISPSHAKEHFRFQRAFQMHVKLSFRNSPDELLNMTRHFLLLRPCLR